MTASPTVAPSRHAAHRHRRDVPPAGSAPTMSSTRSRRGGGAASCCSCCCSCSWRFMLLLGAGDLVPALPAADPGPRDPGRDDHAGLRHLHVRGGLRPMGVAVTPAGDRVYIGETEGPQIARVFDAAGNRASARCSHRCRPAATTSRSTWRRTRSPGEVYVTDRPTGVDLHLRRRRRPISAPSDPRPDVKGWQPLGLTFDAAGNLYVTDYRRAPHRMLVFDPCGDTVRTSARTPTSTSRTAWRSRRPATCTSRTATTAACSCSTGPATRRQVGRGAGEGNLGLPRGVAIDGQGRVYVGDTTGHAVFVYSTFQAGERHASSTWAPSAARASPTGSSCFPNGSHGRCPRPHLRGRLRERPGPVVELLSP